MIKNYCRLCSSKNLYKFLDLGLQPPSDQFLRKEQANQETIFYPLAVNTCKSCGFKQLTHVVDPKILYQQDYPYESSLTKSGLKHFHEFALSVKKRFKLNSDDLVIDIGSNVGVLLNSFKLIGTKVLGVDPAKNICKIANRRNIKTLNSFFDTKICDFINKKYGKAKVITGTNVFAHIDDLSQLIKNIKKILHKKRGIFIIEVPHFLNLLNNLEYDTIYHEHLSYISVQPLIKFLKKRNLEIFRIEKKDIHGGSIRIFISYIKNYKTDKSVNLILNQEKKANLNNLKILKKFSDDIKKNRLNLVNLMTKLKLKKKKIIVLSTPAKGMTLLNYCKLDNDYINFATEKSKLKIGKFTPGSNIPIYNDKKILKEKPDYAIILAWNFAKEIISNNKSFLKKSGKFIIPIPKVNIIKNK
ncbi:class I SAM-dependent methyltransferase [Candidatus Pelagibacter sp.]|nr:class I SAM-dependent methyltransferase [Candidatus Pelagibacter sp.]